MKAPRSLLLKVIKGQLTPTKVLDAVRDLAPKSARNNRFHPWWEVEADDLLHDLALAGSGSVFVSVQEAVTEAGRTHGKVVVEKVSGLVLYRVLPVQEAEVVVTEKIVAEAMPAEMVDPVWDEELPDLDTFRRLAERRYLVRLVDRHRWNITKAAAEAAINRATLHALVGRHGLRRPGAAGTMPEDVLAAEAEVLEMTA